MSEWLSGNLGDIADIVMGQSPTGESVNTNGLGVPLLNGPTEFTIRYPKAVQFSTDPKRFSKVNDILFCVRGSTTGRMNWADEDYAIGRGLAAIRHKQGEEYRYFVKAILDYYLDTMLASASGSTFPNVSKDQLNELEISYPSFPEQKAIASVLSSLDDKIDLLHRQNKTLEAMAETLFRQWFIEDAKEDWEETTLEYHIVAIKGLSYKGSGLCDVGQGIPMFNLNSVLEGGGYKTTGLKYYKGDYKERHLVKADDIIVANTEQGHEHRLIGFPAVIPSYFNGENIFTHHIFKVSTLESTYLTNQFIYYLLRSSAVREQITGATNGSTVNQLAADGLQRPKFRLPPKNLVQSFTNQVISFWRKKDLNQQQIWSLENLRDTLLPKLMSGEVRVQYQTAEVA